MEREGLLVRDVMTGTAFPVGIATPVTFAQEIFGRKIADSLAVVDDEGLVMGSVDGSELARLQVAAMRRGRPRGRAKAKMRRLRMGEVMQWPAVTVDAEDSAREAARTLVKCGAARLVVVDGGGRPAGSVSAIDLVRALLSTMETARTVSAAGPRRADLRQLEAGRGGGATGEASGPCRAAGA